MNYNIVPDYTVNEKGERITRYWGFNIEKVEKVKNAKFVCEVAIHTKNGGWSEHPVAIFWQEKPPVEGYSNYFGLFQPTVFEDGGISYGALMITSGQSAVDDPLTGIVASNGDVVYSAYRHDFRHSPDQSVFIDGGRDYVRCSVPAKMVQIKIIKDKLVVSEEELQKLESELIMERCGK
jgi:hypothetical protein